MVFLVGTGSGYSSRDAVFSGLYWEFPAGECCAPLTSLKGNVQESGANFRSRRRKSLQGMCEVNGKDIIMLILQMENLRPIERDKICPKTHNHQLAELFLEKSGSSGFSSLFITKCQLGGMCWGKDTPAS